ncbi:MAG: aminotransferase class I/II-fold pyridoxal phosphate-dependent enzyme [Candidatus Dadabacteria bacterium]|nr:aminotransferase class I/II-fold pyridoxal phosphate-dependent enzyme [Candidatus Dadabacteria bacterium]MDE0519414.1 aminotransferase class I/II-fold pyridoxal phosphate-dependent enzyme [Candidatus Dadabacteria bacterium]MDE0662662.1 aminotransferase class I/II-fold pyridoxal phosphate-dependent enzyme [Candidatus Dadabacteria bacterium]
MNRPDYNFSLINRLPPYVLGVVNELKHKARARGEDIIDLGMGNPDQATPDHIVEKLREAVSEPRNHRYSASAGLPKLRLAITDWYRRNYDVDLDPDSEAVVTIGSKEGISHLMVSILSPGDMAIVPNPSYPIHSYSVIIARGDTHSCPMGKKEDLIQSIEKAIKEVWPKPKVLILSFPNNPTTQVMDLDFFEKICDLARETGLIVVHDLVYAELCYDGYKAPSIMQVKGAKDVAVEFYSLSKTYSMPGWRVGFMVGNPEIVSALKRIKSYLDYGIFQPIQIAAITALNGPQEPVERIRETYRSRRDKLIESFARAGWEIPKPNATMFVWAQIPEEFAEMGSLEFSKLLIEKSKVAVSPGVGFGNYGEGFVRLALVENENRITQAARGVRKLLQGAHGY